jgi:hypothetical protein
MDLGGKALKDIYTLQIKDGDLDKVDLQLLQH